MPYVLVFLVNNSQIPIMDSFKCLITLFFIFLNPTMMTMFNSCRTASASQSNVVSSLPGYEGTLPFKLETGYIGVGEKEHVQLFYYFVESEGDPERDPLVLWLTGGPGCSGFSGLVYEIGPLTFSHSSFDGSLPSLVLNPYSWTKVASVIFIDSPVGTGFSYATTSEDYASNDTKAVKHNYVFLQKWLLSHPWFIKNRLYVAGDSYGGKIVPLVAMEIVKGNEAGFLPRMTFQGYIVGNSVTNANEDNNEKIPYAHRMALISDEYFEMAKSGCHGDYVSEDKNNYRCNYALQLVNECIDLINKPHILEPKCKSSTPKQNGHQQRHMLLEDYPTNHLLLSKQDESLCRDIYYETSIIWANNGTVRDALHIRKGTVIEWERCNSTLSYERDVESVLECHRLLNSKGYQILAYSGDHDLVVPYMSTLKWIRSLNLTLDEKWRPWNVDGQVAGYTMKYKNNEAYITFATVLGGGHTAPEYKPKQCFEMLKRWFSAYTL